MVRVWFVTKQHNVWKVMLVMSISLFFLYMFCFFRVRSEAASSWDSLFRVQAPSLFGAALAWIQAFWISLSLILLEEVAQG